MVAVGIAQAMTSTASRLATVQRAIETLESQLNRNQSSRETALQARIELLLKELQAVQAGDFEVLDGAKAEEGIREVYQLAVSLQADFRRVEDSYRQADRALRERIISSEHHRGEIVDELLDGCRYPWKLARMRSGPARFRFLVNSNVCKRSADTGFPRAAGFA